MSFYPTFLPWSYPSPLHHRSVITTSHNPRAGPISAAGQTACTCDSPSATPVPRTAPSSDAVPPDPSTHSPHLTQQELARPARTDSPTEQETISQNRIIEKIRLLQERISEYQAKLETVITALQERVSRLEENQHRSEEDSLTRGHQALQTILADLASQGLLNDSFEMTPPTPLPDDGAGDMSEPATLDPSVLPSRRFERFKSPSDNDSLSSISEPPPSPLPDVEVGDQDHEPSEASGLLVPTDDPSTPVSQPVGHYILPPNHTLPPHSAPDIPGTRPITPGCESVASSMAILQRETEVEVSTSTTRQLRPRNRSVPTCRPRSPALHESCVGRSQSDVRSTKRPKTGSGAIAKASKTKKRSAAPPSRLPHGVLGKGSGKPRVAGVKWPKTGDYTVRSVGRDIRCEACTGRAHWTCAGFKDREASGPADWTCPDCSYLKMKGLPDLPRYYDGHCIRPNCVRRLHKKLVAEPGDTELYVTESAIGRRLVTPATMFDGPKYEYLVKWWDYDICQSTWEPESSFTALEDLSSQFLDSALSEGVSMTDLKEGRMILLQQAVNHFDESGHLKVSSNEASESVLSQAVEQVMV